MILDVILFIAYKACSGNDFALGKNPFQYKNAIRLITVLFILHVIQVVLLVRGNFHAPIKSISGVQYLIVLGGSIFLFYLFEIIFSKRILAKSISRYKHSVIVKYAKLIAYGYLIINIGILSLILVKGK